ncbi:MAG TPA: GNAT family N-acetyltransferase [Solirubrobacteraceae bacterium]
MSDVEATPARPAAVIRPARPADVPLLLTLFGELAEYERLTDQLQASEERLARALFGEPPAAEALIAEVAGETAGYALYHPTFSTFLAIQGVWLEDLFVRPAHRGAGVGRALLARVAAVVRERGGERLEWSALDWNELALGFYRRIGAQQMNEWITHRLVGEGLTALAAEDDERR